MYSAILMVALSAGPETPACHWGYAAYPYAPVAWAWYPYYPWPYAWPYWAWYYPWPYYGPYPYWTYFAYAPAYVPPVAVAPAGGAATHSVVTLKLPPGAALLVDGKPAPPPASNVDNILTYRTPVLSSAIMYKYTFSVEIMIDGKPARADKVVHFRPGDPISLDFTAGVKVAQLDD